MVEANFISKHRSPVFQAWRVAAQQGPQRQWGGALGGRFHHPCANVPPCDRRTLALCRHGHANSRLQNYGHVCFALSGHETPPGGLGGGCSPGALLPQVPLSLQRSPHALSLSQPHLPPPCSSHTPSPPPPTASALLSPLSAVLVSQTSRGLVCPWLPSGLWSNITFIRESCP